MAQNPNPSQLDPGQIIKRAFEEANDAIRISGSISFAEQAVDEIGQPIGTDVKLAGGVDGLGNARALRTDINGELQVDVLSSSLPAGAATEAKQDVGNTSLSSIDTKTPDLVSGRVPVDGSGVTQPISAASLPLPTGAATESTLASLDGKVPSPISGRIPVDGSGVTQPVSGPLTDTQLRATPVAISGALTDTELRATPVAVSGPLTDTQLRASAVPVSAASLPLPTGAATQTTLAALSAKTAAGLVPDAHDEVEITYVGSTTNIDTVTYKLATATVATLQLSYDLDNRLVGVVKT